MDNSVLQSIKRWPNVPAVYGWLSLNARGLWRLHPDGQAHAGGAGQAITNPQILTFINRNYARDDQGQWFFQNGPQRVYVRLDAAPWILFADDAQAQLSTHTGAVVTQISQAWMDGEGRVWLQTEYGPGMVVDRDLQRFMAGALTDRGQALENWWADGDQTQCLIAGFNPAWQGFTAPLLMQRLVPDTPADTQLKFVANPQPS